MAQRKLVTFDWAMKRLLRSKANFDILEGFLSELLHENITILEILESESNQDHAEDKYNRVDIKVRDGREQIILIELQYDRQFDYIQRIIYGTAKAVTEHMSSGTAYREIIKVISINILYFDLGVGSDYIYHGRTSFTGLHTRDTLDLTEEQKRFYGHSSTSDIFPEYWLLKVNNFDDVARNTLDEWIYFLKNSEIKEGFSARGLQQAQQKLDILALPKEEYQAWARYEEALHDRASMADNYTIGVMKGERQGMEKGLEQGLEQGEKKGRLLTALAMKRNGLPIETIQVCTGLSREEIDNLDPEE